MKFLYNKICRLEEVICGLGLFSIVVLVFLSAGFRIFNHPIQWSMDLSQLIFAWVAFTGMDIAMRAGGVMGLDLLTKKLDKKIRNIINIFMNFILICFLISLIVYGFKLSFESWSRTYQTLGISYSWATLSLPVCSIFMVMNLVVNSFQIIKQLRVGRN